MCLCASSRAVRATRTFSSCSEGSFLSDGAFIAERPCLSALSAFLPDAIDLAAKLPIDPVRSLPSLSCSVRISSNVFKVRFLYVLMMKNGSGPVSSVFCFDLAFSVSTNARIMKISCAVIGRFKERHVRSNSVLSSEGTRKFIGVVVMRNSLCCMYLYDHYRADQRMRCAAKKQNTVSEMREIKMDILSEFALSKVQFV